MEGKAEGREEGRAEGRAEGKAEGRAEALTETARKMKQAGVGTEQIEQFTGLSSEEISAL